MAWSGDLPSDGVGRAARIGATREDSGAAVGDDAADRPSAPRRLRPPADIVAARGERLAGRGRDAAFDVETAWIVVVRLEGVRETVAGKARQLDGELRVHAEHRDIEED